MVAELLLAVAYLGLGGLIVSGLIFVVGWLWICFGPKPKEHRIPKQFRHS